MAYAANFYMVELNKTEWEVPERYQKLSPVGAGAYGQVCSAEDSIKNESVAIKKLSRPFQSNIHAKRSHRELKLLRHMRHENVIALLNVFTPPIDPAEIHKMNDIYMVTDLMGADLANIIRCQTLTDDHVQFLVYQILRGLKYIHSAGIVHRDLKPSNIAVNEDCELKILDFGLARISDDEMTGYVATRWYRAPEVMLNWMHYTNTVDIWSVGCIMAEMLTGKVLFPGNDHIDQLKRIMAVVGTPDANFLAKIKSEEARKYILSLPAVAKKDFYTFFVGANPEAVNLLEMMLVLDPDHRITADQALEHSYLKNYHDASDEPVAAIFDLSDDNLDISVDEWRKMLWQEICSFHAQ